jgi:hypothetical protein
MRICKRLIILSAIVLLLFAISSGCSGSNLMFPAVTNDWALIWDTFGHSESIAMTSDAEGSIYVAGIFAGESDLDPTEGIDIHSSNPEGGGDTFLSKFDSSGNYHWARTWGGEGSWLGVCSYDVDVDDQGGVYVIGHFSNLVDFNPGEDSFEVSTLGQTDIFLSKFDGDGVFQWVITWGTEGYDNGLAVDVDSSGDIRITGCFEDTIDLDPSDSVDEHVSNGYVDIFILKLASDGGYEWGRSFGGELWEYPEELAVDNHGGVYVTGNFQSPSIDLDPGTGTDVHTSFAGKDAFLVKLDSNGESEWGCTWGGYGDEAGADVAVSGDGRVYVIGSFKDPIDFNIDGETDIHYCSGKGSAYLTCRGSDGDYVRTLSWVGDFSIGGRALAIDAFGNVYACFGAGGIVDLDPGDGEYLLNTSSDVVICKLNPDGEFLWAGQWIGSKVEVARDIALGSMNDIYATGERSEHNPGPPLQSPRKNDMSLMGPEAFLVRFPAYIDE